ncbi:MAG: B12-binding domain-containing radical SAM protein [Desulfomonilaceae bacterium]
MRILLINPEFPPSYWSFPEQLKFLRAKTMVPPLGLLTLAALLPRDWELRLVDLAAQPISDLDWNWPDIVMMSGMLIQKNNLLELVREAKSKAKTVVVGGPYPTSLPEELIAAGCDFVVRGECENTVAQLLESLNQKGNGLVIENPEKPDLSLSPLPRFDLLKLKKYGAMGIQTSRGCPFGCEFCDIINLYGSKPRYKTPPQVVKELETLHKLGWSGVIFICDDNFIGSRKHAVDLLKHMDIWMKANGSPFSFITQASINLGQDNELIDLMTQPNFATVFVGLESPDEDVLAGANKFQNIRNPLLESVKNINRNGLTVLGSFIIGFDGEKPGMGERITAFVNEANIPIIMFNKLQPIPNTKLWDRLEAEGRLLKGKAGGNFITSDFNYIPSRPAEEIDHEFEEVWTELYSPSNFLTRAYNYYLTMRPTRKAMAKTTGEGIPGNPAVKPGLSTILLDISQLVRLSWRQGIVSRARIQYWKQLFGILRKNPSRFVPYLTSLVIAEDMFKLRKEIVSANKSSKTGLT